MKSDSRDCNSLCLAANVLLLAAASYWDDSPRRVKFRSLAHPCLRTDGEILAS